MNDEAKDEIAATEGDAPRVPEASTSSVPASDNAQADSVAGAPAGSANASAVVDPSAGDPNIGEAESAPTDGDATDDQVQPREHTSTPIGNEPTSGDRADAAGDKGASKSKRKKKKKSKAAASDSTAPFLRFFSSGNRRHGFSAGEIVAGRVAEVFEEGAAFSIDLFGKATAIASGYEPREVTEALLDAAKQAAEEKKQEVIVAKVRDASAKSQVSDLAGGDSDPAHSNDAVESGGTVDSRGAVDNDRRANDEAAAGINSPQSVADETSEPAVASARAGASVSAEVGAAEAVSAEAVSEQADAAKEAEGVQDTAGRGECGSAV